MAREFDISIGAEPHHPVIHCKVLKRTEADQSARERRFLYKISLYIKKPAQETAALPKNVEIACFDNYHAEHHMEHNGLQGEHHVHFFNVDGTTCTKDWNFTTIGETIDHINQNWQDLINTHQQNEFK